MPRKPRDKPVDFSDDTEYIARQIKQYESRNKVLQSIVDRGDRIRATATGQAMLDLRTCDCGSFADRRRDHTAQCAVQIVTDPTPVIAALKEIRLNDSYLDGLRRQMPSEDQAEDVAEWIAWLTDTEERNKTLTAENIRLRGMLAGYQDHLPLAEITR